MQKIIIKVATVLTVYGIETLFFKRKTFLTLLVATVLTVYGIETGSRDRADTYVDGCNSAYRLRY